ncbi:molybdenum cofactor biosynthetic protein [Grosmannia clavigera kw1407]|uniref:Adenylyltransferase and sulfurtransferase uba4 n=1 Tax=Grosmannia clavigera (strain kw1407 / UAMH 11150) TaxID=655863 RepID=F0XQX2_GROCL|nr:molybdenum cofactor biosynthetic protein [Grosmannia clavigera kw1407]EFW99752.1 molybdenum cofactor biosynthetic protein [Grosmannia clavigera kw1407]
MAATDASDTRAKQLRLEIARAETELQGLRDQLALAESDEADEKRRLLNEKGVLDSDAATAPWRWPLKEEEYDRYARQLIVPGIGMQGQLRLRAASVLVVGAGGLGCPAATYLAGAGIGHIGIVDCDVVETSNLHRQIGHTTDRVGVPKAVSLATSLRRLNPLPRYSSHVEALTPANAAALVAAYDVVLDCTDNPASRYLVSDACVRASRPLVSAAALRTDGQLAVLNWPVGVGPCYRCIFPRPSPPASRLSCAEGGVLGPVVGVIGVLQALEALRVIMAEPDCIAAQADKPSPSLLLFSAKDGHGRLGAPSFRTVRVGGRRPTCFACSPTAPLRAMESLESVGSSGINGEWPDYVQFCGDDTIDVGVQLAPEERISVQEFQDIVTKKSDISAVVENPPYWLLDVREKEFFDMGSLDGALNLPFSRIQSAIQRSKRKTDAEEQESSPWPEWLPEGLGRHSAPVYVLCRVGINSQMVASQLKEMGLATDGRFIGDIKGGIQAWKRNIDSTIPFT